MVNGKQAGTAARNRVTFFLQFLKNPRHIGSVTPSSRFLEKRVLKTAEITSAGTIVELGPGTGGTTQAILHAMPASARLLSIEINPHFHRLTRDIADRRLIAHFGSACDLKEILAQYGLAAPDVIISGIPFSTMSRAAGTAILATITAQLAVNGRFVAYQASDRVMELCQPFLGTGRVEHEFLNIPPMRVFHWRKQGSHTDADAELAAPAVETAGRCHIIGEASPTGPYRKSGQAPAGDQGHYREQTQKSTSRFND
ncbi:MAG: methyltransferase type 12 [Gammaproteobacteria bacterium]|jgi:phospholipid N-methyltransferase